MNKPSAPSCKRNQDPILNVLKKIVNPDDRRLFEIGSGTGEHAVYFSAHFPNLRWITSDVKSMHPGIELWIKEANRSNLSGPNEFEIGKTKTIPKALDLVFISNVFHIVSWKQVKTLIKLLGSSLEEGAQVIIYGPFNYNGTFTSESNEAFDKLLKEKSSLSGIRSFEDVCSAMAKNNLRLSKDFEMPANNRILLFTKLDQTLQSLS